MEEEGSGAPQDDGIRVTGAIPPVSHLHAVSNAAVRKHEPPEVRKQIKKACPPPPGLFGEGGYSLGPRPGLGGPPREDDDAEDEEFSDDYDDYDEEDEDPEAMAQMELLEEEHKAAMLARISKIKSNHRVSGPVMTRMTAVDDVQFELQRLEDELVLRQSVKVQRRVLMAAASGLEMMSNRTPAKGKLTGWSEAIMANIDGYDDVFDRLHRKHAPKMGFGKGKRTEPELELAMMVGYSAFSFALTSTMTRLGDSKEGFSLPDYRKRKDEMGLAGEEARMQDFTPGGATPAAQPKVVTFGTKR